MREVRFSEVLDQCLVFLFLWLMPGGYSSEFLVGVCRPVPQILTQFQTKIFHFPHPFSDLAPVVQRPDNFIRWIRYYSGPKIIYFTLNVVQGFRTLPNVAMVRVCIFARKRGNAEIFAQIETVWIVTYPLDKVIRPLNNWGLDSKIHARFQTFVVS